MMQDQHKTALKSFYEDKIKEAKEYLQNKYPLEECPQGDVDYPPPATNISSGNWRVWRIKTACSLRPLTLILAIPSLFPDILPKIYLSKSDYSEIGQIPHTDKNRFVCTREENIAVINDAKVGEALEELIRIAAEEIIVKGLNKQNDNDYIEEFLAYWNDDNSCKILSLFVPSEDIELIKVVTLEKGFLESKHLVANTIEEAKEWLSHVDIKIEDKNIYNALYLPFDSAFCLPLPRTNKDIFDILRAFGPKYIDAIKKFFADNEFNLSILFSVSLKQGRALAAWKHLPWGKYIYNGFRPHTLPLDIRFSRSSSNQIERMRVERIDKERLFNRGGKGLKDTTKNCSVAIIGLGSIGSALAMSLAKCGISKFIFIDKEIVTLENVARHLCDFEDVNLKLPKSCVVKQKIERKFPHVKCSTYDNDILALLQNETSLLDSVDIVISANANFGIERRLNSMLRKGVIKSPIFFAWLEPYGVAGHLLYIHPKVGACYQCCFDINGQFQYSVAKQQEGLYKRESGCQSSYFPYSALDVDTFIVNATRRVLEYLEKQSEISFLWSWIGDIVSFKNEGYQICEDWFADSAFSINERILNKQENCEICGKL